MDTLGTLWRIYWHGPMDHMDTRWLESILSYFVDDQSHPSMGPRIVNMLKHGYVWGICMIIYDDTVSWVIWCHMGIVQPGRGYHETPCLHLFCSSPVWANPVGMRAREATGSWNRNSKVNEGMVKIASHWPRYTLFWYKSLRWNTNCFLLT